MNGTNCDIPMYDNEILATIVDRFARLEHGIFDSGRLKEQRTFFA